VIAGMRPRDVPRNQPNHRQGWEPLAMWVQTTRATSQ